MQETAKRAHSQILETDNCFSAETSSFRIKVSFEDTKLIITLQDLVSFVVYSKSYEEDEPNEQINKRVSLKDIFYSLTEYNRQVSEQIPTIYQFGKVFKNNGVPYFKIQQQGKITVYVSVFDRRKQQQIVYQSVLRLNKIRDLTQLQKITEQSITQKKKLLQKVIALRNQKQQVQNKLKAKNVQVENLNKALLAKNQQINTVNIQLNKMVQLRQKIQNAMKGFVITKVDSNRYSQSIYNRAIPYDGVHNFQVKIIKAPKRYIGIGVIDYEKQKTFSTYFDSSVAVGYYWWYENQGQKYPGGEVQSIGFKQGQVVNVRLDRTYQLITWSVDGIIRAALTHKMLGDQSKIFMPYVEFYYQNTSVQWL